MSRNWTAPRKIKPQLDRVPILGVYFDMSYEPLVFVFDGEVYCPDCEPTDAPRDEVGVSFDESEAHGATCSGCRACYVLGYGWEPHETATGPAVVWTRCTRCNDQKPYARATYLQERKRIKARCWDCGCGSVERVRR